MAHPLDGGMVSPPAPNPNPDRRSYNALTGGSNALMMPQQQRRMPAPGHQETVAALRHFMAIIDELQVLLKNPSLGRSDMKDPITDGVIKLVGERMISPANAVPILADIPADPLQQRKRVQQMLQQTVAAQNNVLHHHVMGNPGTLDWATESQHQAGSMDDHMQTMAGLADTYRNGGG
jgi:hypothetical protein